jgi:DNA replicative helicase MCM subunit Mcm2 (Cdc46/Mcm family)
MDPYILVPELCACRDFQNIKVQESPDSIPTAEMPRHIGLYMERSLVDKVVPGNRVMITGIYQIKREQVSGPRSRDKKSGVGIRASYIRVLGVEVDTVGPGRSNEKMRYSRFPNIDKKHMLNVLPTHFSNNFFLFFINPPVKILPSLSVYS